MPFVEWAGPHTHIAEIRNGGRVSLCMICICSSPDGDGRGGGVSGVWRGSAYRYRRRRSRRLVFDQIKALALSAGGRGGCKFIFLEKFKAYATPRVELWQEQI